MWRDEAQHRRMNNEGAQSSSLFVFGDCIRKVEEWENLKIAFLFTVFFHSNNCNATGLTNVTEDVIMLSNAAVGTVMVFIDIGSCHVWEWSISCMLILTVTQCTMSAIVTRLGFCSLHISWKLCGRYNTIRLELVCSKGSIRKRTIPPFTSRCNRIHTLFA